MALRIICAGAYCGDEYCGVGEVPELLRICGGGEFDLAICWDTGLKPLDMEGGPGGCAK